MREVAFITGITGQDGLILAGQLLNEGIEVHGTTRSFNAYCENRLKKTNLLNKIRVHQLDLQNEASVRNLLDYLEPSMIFNFGSLSSVGDSFRNPQMAFESIERPTLYILNWLLDKRSLSTFFNPSSSEMYGDTLEPAIESDPFSPKSPYGVAKLNAYELSLKYRLNHGLNVINGIFFNHESHLRQSKFFSKKVIKVACQLHRGIRVKLEVGNIDGVRDWGWAPDHVGAALALSREKKIDDFVVATGEGNSLQSFISASFSKLDLDWREHTEVSQREIRSNDIAKSIGNPQKIFNEIGWGSSKNFHQLIENLIEEQLREFHEKN
jgi:GDPmannose 4,6-dehydratase